MKELTNTEKRIWAYILDYIEDNTWSPTIQEIADKFGWASKRAAHYWVRKLVAKGYLAYNNNLYRNLVIVNRDLHK